VLISFNSLAGAWSEDGSRARVENRLAEFEERQRLVDKDAWDALAARFAHAATGSR